MRKIAVVALGVSFPALAVAVAGQNAKIMDRTCFGAVETAAEAQWMQVEGNPAFHVAQITNLDQEGQTQNKYQVSVVSAEDGEMDFTVTTHMGSISDRNVVCVVDSVVKSGGSL